jgi:hypothetical protein
LIISATVSCPAVQAASAGCGGTQYRAFDFFIGTWVGRNAKGELRGKSEVMSVLAGCSIRMHWTGRTFEGTNNNTYDVTRGIWQKAWFDNTGGVELSTGTASPGKIVYQGYDYDKGRVASLHRESWILLPDGRVLEHYELSTDGGRTWKLAFNTFYSRITRDEYNRIRIVQDE